MSRNLLVFIALFGLLLAPTTIPLIAHAPAPSGADAKPMPALDRLALAGSLEAPSQVPSFAGASLHSGQVLQARFIEVAFDADDAAAPHSDEDGANRDEPPPSSLLSWVAAGQQAFTAWALAPQRGIAPIPPNPADLVGHSPYAGPSSQAAEPPGPLRPLTAQGWWLQASWPLALVAFAVLASRPSTAPACLPVLFSRFTRHDVLDHERRARLFECVRSNPGIAFGEAARHLDLAPGVVQHHLRLLERHDLVRRLRDGRTSRLYPRGPKPDPPTTLAPARARVLAMLREHPGLTTPELAARLGRRIQSAWEQVRKLATAGLVVSERRGRRLAWSVRAG